MAHQNFKIRFWILIQVQWKQQTACAYLCHLSKDKYGSCPLFKEYNLDVYILNHINLCSGISKKCIL